MSANSKEELSSPLIETEEAISVAASEGIEPGAPQRGEKQPNKCRDWPFAVLFYGHFITLLVLAFAYGVEAMADENDDNDNHDEDNDHILLSLIVCAFSFLFALMGLAFMMSCSKLVIRFSLVMSVVLALTASVVSFVAGYLGIGFVNLALCFFFALYAWMVWKRTEFAAANLKTAISAINANFSLIFLAYLLILVAIFYTAIWGIALVGIHDKDDGLNGGAVFGFLLMIFWTQQVIQNTITATTAGTIASWWFDPTQSRCFCSQYVNDSFKRTITYSFGSICLGSLIVATVQVLKQLAEAAQQEEGGNNILLCIAQCFLQCIENILKYFNKWAYIYVGIYGYSYIQAGKKVTELFQAKGWTAIIADDLIVNALSLITLAVGLASGIVALGFKEACFDKMDDDAFGIFGYGFLFGIFLSSIMFSVVASAVNAVIVLFAEAPSEFDEQHPELSENMREAWKKAYPVACGF